MEKAQYSSQDVIRVYQVVVCLPELKSSLAEYTGPHQLLIQSIYIQPLEEYISQLEKLVQLVETTVDLDAANHHEYIIKSDFNPELAVIRGKMKEIQEDIRSLAEQVYLQLICRFSITLRRKAALDLGVEYEKKLKYETNSQYGHYLRLSRNVIISSWSNTGRTKCEACD